LRDRVPGAQADQCRIAVQRGGDGRIECHRHRGRIDPRPESARFRRSTCEARCFWHRRGALSNRWRGIGRSARGSQTGNCCRDSKIGDRPCCRVVVGRARSTRRGPVMRGERDVRRNRVEALSRGWRRLGLGGHGLWGGQAHREPEAGGVRRGVCGLTAA
jgi:hypothetical protein